MPRVQTRARIDATRSGFPTGGLAIEFGPWRRLAAREQHGHGQKNRCEDGVQLHGLSPHIADIKAFRHALQRVNALPRRMIHPDFRLSPDAGQDAEHFVKQVGADQRRIARGIERR
jgi:hypothetical protein